MRLPHQSPPVIRNYYEALEIIQHPERYDERLVEFTKQCWGDGREERESASVNVGTGNC